MDKRSNVMRRRVKMHRGLNQPPEEVNGVHRSKNRMRDLQRLLKHANTLPADIRLNHERELSSLHYEVEQRESKKSESRMIKKYHMVRFFERQKATRGLKKAVKQLNECTIPEEKQALEQKVHQFEVDLNYTQYFPLHQPYISLYVQNGKRDAEGHQEYKDSKINDMWHVVEAAMRTGTLDALRNSKMPGGNMAGGKQLVVGDSRSAKTSANKLSKPPSNLGGLMTQSSGFHSEAGGRDELNDEVGDGDDFFE